MKKQKHSATPNAKKDPTAAASSRPSKPWKNGKPPPDHPMWQRQQAAIERVWARRKAQGNQDRWDEMRRGPRDFRKGLSRPS